MGNLVFNSLDGETKYLESYNGFLSSGIQLVQEEDLAQADLESKNSRKLEIAELRLSIDKMQKALGG